MNPIKLIGLTTALGAAMTAAASQISGVFPGSTDFEDVTLPDSWTTNANGAAIVAGTPGVGRPTNFIYNDSRTNVLSTADAEGTVWRDLNAGGASTAFAGGAIYADLLFNASAVATSTPTAETGDKILIYLKDDGSSTNLCVFAQDPDDDPGVGKEFPLITPAGAGSIAAGNWYRLVIKAFDITEGGAIDPGFQVFLGGCSNDYLCQTADDEDVFMAIGANGQNAGSVASIGFRGNGLVDDLVVSTLDPSVDQFDWATHLGAAVDGAYQIDDEAELIAFQQGVANELPTANTTFKLTADIALTAAWPGIGTYDNTVNADAFQGTFDGAGHRISNVVFANASFNNYRGFFNQVYNATIKDLTIQWAGWEAGITGEYGGAALVGCANNSTLLRLTAEGTIASGAHNNAGIVVRASGLTSPTTISCCTNKMAITGNYTKVAGICALTQSGTSTVTFDACVNEGAITAATAAGLANAGRDGLAGILAYAANGDGKTIINNCVNAGTINGASGFSGSHSGYTGAKAGQLVGWVNNSVSLTGANTVKDDYLAVGAYSSGKTTGQNFATVSGTTATMVADANVAAGATQYKAMTEKAAFTFAAAGTLIVDEALKAATVTAPGLVLSSATSGTVKTYTARAYATPTVTVTGGANATAEWTVNGSVVSAPATLTEGDTYSVTYTANEGYEFAAGAVTSASGTAGTENIAITIADAVASVVPYGDGDGEIPAIEVSGGATHTLTDGEADYLNDLVEAKGGTAAAQTAVEAAVATITEQAFADAVLLNQDITDDGFRGGTAKFEISNIRNVTGGIEITVKLQPASKMLGNTINGHVNLYAYNPLSGEYVKQDGKEFTFTFANPESPAATTATVTFTGDYSLFKAVIEE